MLYYEKRGVGPAVVLLHGLPCNHKEWYQLSATLSNRFTFVLPDFPGAGNSAERESGLTLKEVAQEVAAIMEKEKIHQAIMAGHSMGGYTAMAFAKMFPEKTKAVSLIHSSTAADTEEKKQNRLKSIALIKKGADAKKAFVKALMYHLFDADFANKSPVIIQDSITVGNQLSANTLIQWYEALMNREDTTDVLQNNQFPIQWILGENDTATNLEATLRLAHLSRLNDICVYPDCGHMSMLEKPENLANDVNRFWSYVYGL